RVRLTYLGDGSRDLAVDLFAAGRRSPLEALAHFSFLAEFAQALDGVHRHLINDVAERHEAVQRARPLGTERLTQALEQDLESEHETRPGRAIRKQGEGRAAQAAVRVSGGAIGVRGGGRGYSAVTVAVRATSHEPSRVPLSETVTYRPPRRSSCVPFV